ncbi:MAG: c-type cytochrome [Methylococcaceae bacterium]|nr:c-type cytochrome [Methylococcaceae bacterium]
MRASNLMILTLMAAATAYGAPSTQVAWTPQTLQFVKSGKAEHGKELAQTCNGCHAAADNPAPSLEGQLATYLYRQLQDFKAGSRKDPVMSALSSSLSDQDMADLAAWYAGQEAFAGTGGVSDPTGIAGRGDPTRMEPPCAVCHSGSGAGEKVDTPRLSGQKTGYLEKTLTDYKAGTRTNDVYHRMRLIAGKLNDKEIKQLADYYSKLR